MRSDGVDAGFFPASQFTTYVLALLLKLFSIDFQPVLAKTGPHNKYFCSPVSNTRIYILSQSADYFKI